MLMNRPQLAMNLSYLAKEDYALLNDIIVDYCNLIDDNKFNRLEDVVNSELQSILWTLLTQTLRDFERVVNNNVSAILTNLIDTNCSFTKYHYYSMLSGVDKPA